MGEFLRYIQIYHNSVARKIRNLRSGTAFPRRRRDIDVQIDAQIHEAMGNFNARFYNGGIPIPHTEVIAYTLHMANLIGQHEESGLQENA